MLDLRPDMGSLATGSVNFPTNIHDNPPAFGEGLAKNILDYERHVGRRRHRAFPMGSEPHVPGGGRALPDGLEDNTRFDATRLAASNAELVRKIVDVCESYDRRPATAAEARQILGLRPAG